MEDTSWSGNRQVLWSETYPDSKIKSPVKSQSKVRTSQSWEFVFMEHKHKYCTLDQMRSHCPLSILWAIVLHDLLNSEGPSVHFVMSKEGVIPSQTMAHYGYNPQGNLSPTHIPHMHENKSRENSHIPSYSRSVTLWTPWHTHTGLSVENTQAPYMSKYICSASVWPDLLWLGGSNDIPGRAGR